MNLPTMVASRQRAEPMPLAGLPVSGLLAAAASVETRPARATGTDAVVGLVVSDVAGTVHVLGAPAVVRGNRTRPGTFVRMAGPFPTSADPETGRQVAIVDEQVRADFVKIRYVNGAAKQGAFELSFSLIPIYPYKRVVLESGDIDIGAVEIKDQDSDLRADVTPVGGGLNGLVVTGPPGGLGSDILGNRQVQTVEAIGLLAALATFDGSTQDSIDHEAFSASLTVASALGTTVVIRFQQRAAAPDTFRTADEMTLAVPAGGALVNFDRVWSVTRQFVRAQVENTGANPLTVAELVTMRKPVS